MSRSTTYNPAIAPDPATWLAEPEQERIRSVATFHMVNRLKAGNAKAHAAVHVIVENQVAMGVGPTVRAIKRLQGQGLSRHDALHAVGAVVSSYMLASMRTPKEASSASFQSEINAAIEQLDAESWRKEYGA
jgi:hypothetical protein